jgi:DHA2 family methylenomycin A resistance protein-like MFS transporter
MVRLHVPPSIPRAVRVPGLAGVALGVVALATLTFALIEGASQGWGEPLVVACGVVALAAGGGFVALQRTGREPLLPRRLFANREMSVVVALGLLFNFTAYAQMFILSLYFQRDWGYSALETALMFLPAPLGTLLSAVRVGPWAARVGPRAPLAIGMVMNALGPLIVILADGSLAVPIALLGLFVAGISGGLAVPGLNIVVAVSTPPDLIGVGTGALNASRQIGGVLGIAILGAVIGDATQTSSVHLAMLLGSLASFAAFGIALAFVRSGPARQGEEVVQAREPELEVA